MLLTRNSRNPSTSGFPALQLTVLAICRLAEPIALTSVLPLAYPMVKGFDVFEEKDVAFYAGILVSSFSLSEAITGCYWGGLSDRIGRKPVLLLGLFGTMLSMILLGFSTNFWMALFARALGGFLNGNIGVIQTMVGELVKNPEHEPRAYAVMPFVWSIGTIFGPTIGALTANSPLSPSLPYLLPNLICAGLLLISILVGYFLLEETRNTTWDEIREEENTDTEAIMAVSGATQNPTADLRGDSYGTFNRVTIEDEFALSHPPTLSPSASTERVFNKRIVMLVACLGIYCYHSMAYDHLLPIFAQDERSLAISASSSIFEVSGGLGLSTRELGIVLCANGVIALLIQGVVFPYLAGWLGVWRLFQAVILLFPTAYLVVPLLTTVPIATLYPFLYACLTLRNLFSILAYPLILILCKEACSSKHLGKINGLAATVGAASRCIAPPVSGWLYSVGVAIGFTGLAWWGNGLIALVGAVQLLWIQREKNKLSTVQSQTLRTDEEQTLLSDTKEFCKDSVVL